LQTVEEKQRLKRNVAMSVILRLGGLTEKRAVGGHSSQQGKNNFGGHHPPMERLLTPKGYFKLYGKRRGEGKESPGRSRFFRSGWTNFPRPADAKKKKGEGEVTIWQVGFKNTRGARRTGCGTKESLGDQRQ